MPENYETLFARVREQLYPLGLRSIDDIHLWADESSGSRIPVVLVIQLRGVAGLDFHRELPTALVQALDQLALVACRTLVSEDESGAKQWRVCELDEYV